MKHLVLVLIFAFFCAVVFFCFPQIDLYISSLFYDNQIGFKDRTYYLENFDPLMLLWDYFAGWAVPFLFIVFLITWTVKIYRKEKSIHYKNYIAIIYIVLSTLIGPISLVYIMKDQIFCRARPYTIKEFDGNKQFTRAFELSNQCAQKCSFVSGHTAVIFTLLSFAFFIEERKKRKLTTLAIILFGLFIGLGRISFGMHFASDIVFAGFLIYIVLYVMAILFKLPGVRTNDSKKKTD